MFLKLSTHLKRTRYLPLRKMKAPRRIRMKGRRPCCRKRHLSRKPTCVTQPAHVVVVVEVIVVMVEVLVVGVVGEGR